MERVNVVYKGITALCGSCIIYLFGGWSALLGILLAVIVLDYFTGLTAAALSGSLCSAVGMRGIAKKVCIFVLVAVAHLTDTALNSASILRDATILFYVGNESISIIENCGKIGLPIPKRLMKTVATLKGRD